MRQVGVPGLIMILLMTVACQSGGNPSPQDAGQDGSRGSITMADASIDVPTDLGTSDSGTTTTSLFPEGAPWYRDVSASPADGESSSMIAALAAAGGFGMDQLLVDFSFEVVMADVTAPMVPLVPGPDFAMPDCDQSP